MADSTPTTPVDKALSHMDSLVTAINNWIPRSASYTVAYVNLKESILTLEKMLESDLVKSSGKDLSSYEAAAITGRTHVKLPEKQ